MDFKQMSEKFYKINDNDSDYVKAFKAFHLCNIENDEIEFKHYLNYIDVARVLRIKEQ